MKYLSLGVVKKLGELTDLPAPIDDMYMCALDEGFSVEGEVTAMGKAHELGQLYPSAKKYPVYRLHDLVSKVFCDAVAPHLKSTSIGLMSLVVSKFYWGGMALAEAEIVRLMTGNEIKAELQGVDGRMNDIIVPHEQRMC